MNRRRIGFSTLSATLTVALGLGLGAVQAQQCTQDRLYVNDASQNAVFQFAVPGGTLGTTYTGAPPLQLWGIVVDAAETNVYAAHGSPGEVTILPVSGAPVSSLAGGFSFPFDVALTRDESTIYMADNGGSSLRTITLTPVPGSVGTVAGAFTDVTGVTLNSAENLAYVAVSAPNRLATVDLTAPGLLNTVASFATAIGDVELSPSENLAYVTDPAGGRLLAVDLRDASVTVIASGLGAPARVDLDQTGNLAYVSDGCCGVNVVDLVTGVVTAFPASIALTGSNGLALARATDPTLFISDQPNDLRGMQGGTLSVPVNLTNATGRGIQGIDVEVVFDPSVLDFTGGQAGPLAGNCTFFDATLAAPGTVRVDADNCAPIDGAGPVAFLQFDIVGTPVGGSMPLTLQATDLSPLLSNQYCTRAGEYFARNGTVSGKIEYYANGADVDDVSLTLTPPGNTATTDSAGDYSVAADLGVNSTLVPTKIGDFGSAVSVLDTLVAAQMSAALILPTPDQNIAGDVTANCVTYPGPPPLYLPVTQCVTIVDALAINRFAAGLLSDFPARNDEWAFVPAPTLPVPGTVVTTRSPSGGTNDRGEIDYAPLGSSATGQDWRAMVFGDVNGDWSPSAPAPPPLGSGSGDLPVPAFQGVTPMDPALVSAGTTPTPGPAAPAMGPTTAGFFFSGASGLPGDSTVVSLLVKDSTGAEALDIVIYYNPGVGTPTSVELTPQTSGSLFVQNLNTPGVIRAGVAGPGVGSAGALLDITFDIDGAAGEGMLLDMALASLDEGVSITSVLDDSLFCVEGAGFPPAEPQNLLIAREPGESTTLTWDADDASAPAYRVYRSVATASLPVDLDDLGCLGYTATNATRDDDPLAPGELAVYLVAAENCHGISTLGGTNTHPRPAPPDCP